jgi:ribonuclease-3
MSRLEEAIGHWFTRPELLETALTHRSYSSEYPAIEHFERFEFLGDAVLQMVVTDYLFENYPELSEGQMAKVRAASVNKGELALVAREIDLGRELRLGKGEGDSGGGGKDSILADAMEAVIAAVYLDGGYDTARRVVLERWHERVKARAIRPGLMDYKTRLQEVLAAAGLRPEYVVEGIGPEHAREFWAKVLIDAQVAGKGTGRSKKEAEQEAARTALNQVARS